MPDAIILLILNDFRGAIKVCQIAAVKTVISLWSTSVSTIESGNVRAGMGALAHESGVAFRVWAPHADAVFVTGSFNDWSPDAHPMAKEGDGYWYADIATAAIGNEYRYRIVSGDKQLLRIDPYARQVTSSVGNAVDPRPAL